MRGCGLQCVTTTGHYKMLLLSVENLITKVSAVIYLVFSSDDTKY